MPSPDRSVFAPAPRISWIGRGLRDSLGAGRRGELAAGNNGRNIVRIPTGAFYATAMGAALLAGCTTQQASAPPVSTPPPASAPLSIDFRVVPDQNPAGCRRFDAALSRVHTFTGSGATASLTSAGGISTTLSQTEPGIYTTDFSLGGTTLRVVANATSTPKSLNVTEPRLGCRWSAIAP